MIRGDSVWAEPFLEDYDDLAAITLAEDNAWLKKLWALTDALVSHAAGRFPVAVNEFMSPLSAVADLRGNTRFAFDLYDRPDEVVQALNKFTAMWSDRKSLKIVDTWPETCYNQYTAVCF